MIISDAMLLFGVINVWLAGVGVGMTLAEQTPWLIRRRLRITAFLWVASLILMIFYR